MLKFVVFTFLARGQGTKGTIHSSLKTEMYFVVVDGVYLKHQMSLKE